MLHSHDAPALAVSVTVPPAQKVVGPDAVTVATGKGLTVTVVGEDVAEHPAVSNPVTVKLPDVVTVMDCEVAPFDHV